MLKQISVAVALTLIAGTVPAAAQDTPSENSGKSTEEHAKHAIMTPVRDLNLEKDPIPQKLLDAETAPYSAAGMSTCKAIAGSVTELNQLLGPDLDDIQKMTDAEKREAVASRAAGGFIGGLIPFRGLVREASGAASKQRQWEAALLAGHVRRAFLKGIGKEKGCKGLSLR